MARRDGELERVYEGARALTELLEAAGSGFDVDGVKALFQGAQAEGAKPGEVFPVLFEEEPRFPSPELARRLYGNLFGLWDRVARGVTSEPKEVEDAQPEAVPPPAAIDGAEIPDAFVEQAYRALTTLPERDAQRLRDRFEQRESALVEALRMLALAPVAEENAVDLAFELWLMAGWAFGDRAGRADFGKLRAPEPKAVQPALDRYIADWLDSAGLEEDEPLGAEDRAKLEPLIRAAADQLGTPR